MNVPAASYNPSPYFAFPGKKRVALGQAMEEQFSTGGGSGTGGGSVWDIISQQIAGWSKTGQQILLSQNIPTTYTRGPGGVVTYTQQGRSDMPIFQAADIGGTARVGGDTGMGMILVAGAALLVVVVMMGRKG